MIGHLGMAGSSRRTRRAAVRGAAALAGLAAASGLAACGAAGGRGDSAPIKKPAAPVEIEHWATNTAAETPEGKARGGVLDLFAQKNPDLVKISHGQGGTANSLDKIKTAMAAGTPPNIAVFHQYWGSDIFTSGGLVDVNELLKNEKDWAKTKADLYPQLITANTWKGKMFGVPLFNSYFNMYYHRGLLSKAGQGAPKDGWTWDEFMAMAKRAAQPPDVWGFNDGWQTAYQRMWAGSNGHAFLNRDGTKVQLTAQENVDAVQFEVDLLKAGLMRDASARYEELLPTGGVVFQFAVPQRISLYRQQNVDFGTTPYPIGPGNKAKKPYTLGSSYGFGVFKVADTTKQQIAALAAKFAAQKDGQLFVTRTAVVPIPNKAVVESAEFKSEFSKDAHYWPFIEVLPHFDPYPNFPKFQMAYDALSAQLQRVWKGEASPRDAMGEAERLCQQFLDESLRLG
jgi:multiple sugar transport system substrate-binding protein